MSPKWKIKTFDSLESTQVTTRQKAQEGAEEGLVIQALEQTDGQGRHGREWVSPKGNLYISILLKPACKIAVAPQLSFAAALAVSDTIDEYIDDQSLKILKWPNDVLLDGKKGAGILLETENCSEENLKWLILGIGVNIVSAPDIGTALNEYAKIRINLNDFLDRLLGHLSKNLQAWQTQGFEKTRALWLSKAHKPGTKLQIKLGKTEQAGYFHDIDDHGNLQLKGEDGGIKTISAGDVFIA